MKKFRLFVVAVLVITVLTVALPALAQGEEPPPPAGDVTLPVDLEGLIKLGVVFLVTQGLKSVSTWFGKDLSGNGARIAASISAAVILFFNSILSAVPEPAQATVAATLALIVTILGAFGVHTTVKSFQRAKK